MSLLAESHYISEEKRFWRDLRQEGEEPHRWVQREGSMHPKIFVREEVMEMEEAGMTSRADVVKDNTMTDWNR